MTISLQSPASVVDPAAERTMDHPVNACEACEGRGYIVGADLGIVGMVADDGSPIRIPCIVCEGVSNVPRSG